MTPMPSPVKRRYDAPRRREAAARTRAAILDAARQLFTEGGYAATSMTAIADRAGVALDTVYASVGRKPELARLLIETAISGTDQAVPAEQRDYVRAIQAAPDADTKIALYAAAITAIAPRLVLVLGIIQQAAHADPELAALWARSANAAPRTCACSSRTWPRSPRYGARARAGCRRRLGHELGRDVPAARRPARLDPAALRALPRRYLAALAAGRLGEQ